MDYYITSSLLSAVFTVPTAVVDNHLKLAKAEHIKVLLYIMRNMSCEVSEEAVSEQTGVSVYDVKEAMLYWADAGILIPKNKPHPLNKALKHNIHNTEKPSRADAIRRGLEDEKIRYLLNETQAKLGRNLKENETRTLVWLYDDEGLEVSLILLIVQYAVSHKKANIRFIESVATDWIEKGIDNIADADEELRLMAIGEQAWGVVSACFGIERRKPSKKETELSLKWIDDWKISKEMLSLAYDECVNAKSKFSFAYVSKIIENWHKNGYKAPSDVENSVKKQSQKGDFAAYDLDLFEKMLNSKD